VILVLDSSAMLALLNGEPEGQLVRALLIQADEEGEGEVYAHAVNLAEVFYNVMGRTDRATAEAEIERLFSLGVRERRDLDGAFWRDVAATIAAARALVSPDGTRAHLALGDAFGVVLANRLGADFVTKDRAEIEPLANLSLVSALFIR